MVNGLLQDMRYGLRELRKSPAFAVVATITLALAIGANTAIFSVVNRVLLESAPFPHADRLMMVWGRNTARDPQPFPISGGVFTDWKQQNDVFQEIAASFDNEMTLTGSGEPRLVIAYDLTPNYFRILSVAPKMGRIFSDAEGQANAQVAVISDKFWRTVVHGDPDIIGKTITLNAKPYSVIGVMPPEFNQPPQTEIWVPMSLTPSATTDYASGHRFIRVLGRLKPGVSVAQAQARMDALERKIAALHPASEQGNTTLVEPLTQELAGDIRTPLLALLGAVGFVLLIACLNIASLLLARVSARRTEVSVRAALGASRVRLVRQFLVESFLLAVPGGLLGVILAFWSTRFLLAIFPNNVMNLSIPHIESIPVNAAVLWFALGITLLAGLLFGVLPALQCSNANTSEALKESGRVVGLSVRSQRSRHILVVAEVSLSLILLAGAGLMVESFRHVYNEDLGFRPEHLLGVEVVPPPNRYPPNQPEKQVAFVNSVVDRLQRLPGVQSAAVTNYLPLTGFWGTTEFQIEGRATSDHATKPLADNRKASPGYFATMGIPLLKGRDFNGADRAGSERVAIVNSTLAKRYFGKEDPLDKVLEIEDGGSLERYRVVGVIADVKEFGPEQETHTELYRPLAQGRSFLLAFVMRTSTDPGALLKPAEQAIWDVDGEQPVFDAMPMTLLAGQSLTLRRTSTITLTGFAVLALLLAAVGLYGVIAYSVTQRAHEIGIRMALGAKRRDVVRMMLDGGLRLVLIGELIGLAASLVLMRFFASLFVGVSAHDPGVMLLGLATLTAVSLLASYIPARRAAKVDPMLALRYE
ncbi:MAG TPA: ABC transporter permease [Terriglobales bacterium]